MDWRRSFLRLWIVLSGLWAGVAYLYVDPGHDIYRVAIVDFPEGPGLTVPLNISRQGIHNALTNYYAEVRPGQSSTEAQIAEGAKLVRAEVNNLTQRNSNERRYQWSGYAVAAITVPASVLAFGSIVAWVLSGFRKRTSHQ
jgi:hypothetical protein